MMNQLFTLHASMIDHSTDIYRDYAGLPHGDQPFHSRWGDGEEFRLVCARCPHPHPCLLPTFPSPSVSASTSHCSLSLNPPLQPHVHHHPHPSDDEINGIGELIHAHSESVELNTGDMVVLDNTRWGHGREPYEGERRILVSMSTPLSRRTMHVPSSLNAASYC